MVAIHNSVNFREHQLCSSDRNCGAASVGVRYYKISFINWGDNVNWPP